MHVESVCHRIDETNLLHRTRVAWQTLTRTIYSGTMHCKKTRVVIKVVRFKQKDGFARVVGPKVMSPLADAVTLVHDDPR